MQSLTPLPPVESLSPRVVRVLGQNPGKMTLQGTNTYLIGTGARRMLLDAGEGGIPEYVAHLRAAMIESGVRSLAAIVLTHHHYDHVGGVPEVLAMLRELAATGAADASHTEAPRIFKQKVAHEDAGMEFLFDDICQDQEISVEGATLRAIRTPGHTDDHMCFALVEEQAIFCGDTVLGQGTCVFRNLKTYMASLGALIAAKPQRMFPGHGPVIEQGVPFVQAYVEHRMKRERQIVEALGDGGGARTAMELVKLLYSDIGEHLHSAAEGNVLLHLGKLWQERRVSAAEDGATISTPDANSNAESSVLGDKDRLALFRWQLAQQSQL